MKKKIFGNKQLIIPQQSLNKQNVESFVDMQKRKVNEHMERRRANMRTVAKVLDNQFKIATSYVKNSSEYYQYAENGVEGTQLIELKISHVRRSVEIFSDIHPNNCTPLVLIPKFKLDDLFYHVVPAGCYCVQTFFRKIVGLKKEFENELVDFDEIAKLKNDPNYTPPGCVSPGIHWMPPGKKISFIISKNFVPFDYVSKMCPTLDHVFVNIDTLIMFHILRPIVFIAKLGPYKLTTLLRAFLEESIRSLARQSTYHEVYDLKGDNLSSMVRDLNQKLKEYGVQVVQVNITRIDLPSDIQNALARYTFYESKESLRTKEMEYNVLELNNKEDYKNHKRRRENGLLEKQANDYKSLQIVRKDVEELKAVTDKRLAQIKSTQQNECERIKQLSLLEEAKINENSTNMKLVLNNEGSKEASIIKANEYNYKTVKESEVDLSLARNTSECMKIKSEAEGKSAKKLESKRKYDIEKRKIDLLKGLHGNGKLFIAGSSEHTSLSQIIGSSDYSQFI